MSNSVAKDRRALVTGATGFIGSHLVRRLLVEGWSVHVIVRPETDRGALSDLGGAVEIYEHDGTTEGMIRLVKEAAPDVVFHLASLFLAQHRVEDVARLITSNVLFSTQLVEGMLANDVRMLVNTGTSWQHFEDAPYNPVNLYAATKQAFEDILDYYVNAHGLRVITLALFDTYGPNDPRPKLISLLWKTALEQTPIAMSPGLQKIDLVHVDDVVEAFVLSASMLERQTLGHERYGVSSGAPMRLVDLVDAFERATGCEKLPIEWGGRPYRPREVMEPWQSYRTPPGWTPHISFAEGIVQTRPKRTEAS
ncbi:MAG: NAD(P)-dependent oxidoreductase [Acidihalobacter sp.]|uniref:NAD-dependent epimerase/dehydratase family protein n=1 Tax=Acidihalobacter sp. TaxID=1872108 RepID=UPI00307E6A5B